MPFLAPKLWRFGIVTVLLCQLAASDATVPCLAVDGIVVRPEAWQAAVQPWKAYRERQGLQLLEVDAELGREKLQRFIQRTRQEHSTCRYLILMGDVRPRPQPGVPTFYRDSTAMVQFHGDPVIATDNPYADIDDDEIPELALGRIPADSAEELGGYLTRVMDYERLRQGELWRRDVHVVAGVGGFGPLADSVIEMTTRRFLADRIPGWSNVTMTQASVDSPYCPDPFRFSETCIQRFNQGGTFWVYIGHGHVRHLDYLRVKREFVPILTHREVPAINAGQRPPIAIFLACYTGAFDATEDALAEELLMREGGPIATLAASRVSGPYGLAMLSDGLLNNYFEQEQPTLGQIVLRSKQAMLRDGEPEAGAGADQMQMISAIASALSPPDYDLRAERIEHVWQMHLLGDPLLRLNYPRQLQLEIPNSVHPGENLSVRGRCQSTGTLTLELAWRRDQVRKDLSGELDDPVAPEGRQQRQSRYQAANQRVLITKTLSCQPGEFEVQLAVPQTLARGRYCVRGFLQADEAWEVGYAETAVRPARRSATPDDQGIPTKP